MRSVLEYSNYRLLGRDCQQGFAGPVRATKPISLSVIGLDWPIDRGLQPFDLLLSDTDSVLKPIALDIVAAFRQQ